MMADKRAAQLIVVTPGGVCARVVTIDAGTSLFCHLPGVLSGFADGRVVQWGAG